MRTSGKVVSFEETSKDSKFNYAVVGLYFYDLRVVKYAKELRPSERGEFEITDLNKIYLEDASLDMEILGRDFFRIDTGTLEPMAEVANYVRDIEYIQGTRISVLEEIAFYNGWINEEQV